MIRLFVPLLIAIALCAAWLSQALALPEGAVDCHTSDVPGGVTVTFVDGSQLVLPSILPTFQGGQAQGLPLQNHQNTFQNTSNEAPQGNPVCSGPVGDPILKRANGGELWEAVIQRTFCKCEESHETRECGNFKGVC